jgi:hypothetical protein
LVRPLHLHLSIMRLSSLVLVTALFIPACAASSSEELADETGSNATDLPASDLYLLDTKDQAGEVEIHSATADALTFSLMINAKSGTGTGELGMNGDAPKTAQKSGDGWRFKEGECEITFASVVDAIKVTDNGACFGIGADANGKYQKAAPKPQVGTYVLDTKGFDGTVKVESVDNRTMKFSLEVSRKDNGNQGSLESQSATRERTAWRHETTDALRDALNCRLDFEFRAGALDVTQKEACGFGLNVFADGTYKKR